MSNKPTVEPAESGEANASHAPAESPVLIHIWLVDPQREGVAAQRLDEMLRQVTTERGFVSARVLESPDRRSIAAVVEMRAAEDRQRLEQLPVVHNTLRDLDGTINMVVRLYHEIEAYHA